MNANASLRTAYRLLALFFLLVLWAVGCSDGGSSGDVDGDSLDGDEDGDILDGDDENEQPPAEREPPEVVMPSWNDDTAGRYQVTPFCETGFRLLDERFSDAVVSAERWTRVGDAGGEPVFVTDEDGKPWLDLQSLQGDSLRASTLDNEFTANAFSILTGTKTEDANAVVRVMLAEDDADNPPEGRMVLELGAGKVRLFQDETATVQEAALPGAAPYLVVLYLSNQGEVDLWRVDVNDRTLLDVQFPSVNIRRLFLSGSGLVGAVTTGGACLKPDVLESCEQTACLSGMVCGRDKLCHPPRALSCGSDNGCTSLPGTICQGIGYGELQGLGTCTVSCNHHADCRAQELCHPVSGTEGVCRTACEVNADCEADQACEESLGIKGCMPKACVRDGHWENGPLNLPVCHCDEGYVFNPDDFGCDAATACSTHADCQSTERCRDGLCHKARNRSCVNDEGCAPGMACHAVFIHGEIQAAGICLAECTRDYDCLSYERCRPADETRWACLPACDNDEAACLAEQTCLPAQDEHFCMPSLCQTYGQWTWSLVLGNFTCVCNEDRTTDPTTGRCR